jgi:Golgi SNAP receptor complex protein 1
MQSSASPLLINEEADMSTPNTTTTLQSWDQLRKEARTLESEIESKLATLTKIGQSSGLDNTGQEAEAEELLKKVKCHFYSSSSHIY